jgi:hypothetical protein
LDRFQVWVKDTIKKRAENREQRAESREQVIREKEGAKGQICA